MGTPGKVKAWGGALILCAVVMAAASVWALEIRVKNAAKIQGVRENQLIGYGLVVGLGGTGDREVGLAKYGTLTVQSVANMLAKFGMIVAPGQIKPRNVAAVMVVAQLPPFMKPGDKIDVVVSSIGDARSLQGGTLVQTPLLGADGNIYAVGQGPVSTGGNQTQPGMIYQRQNVTTARIPLGALVEKEVPVTVMEKGYLNVILNRPDYTSAARLTDVINKQFWGPIASAVDAATIRVEVPIEYQRNTVEFIAAIEGLTFPEEEMSNKVAINERTGTIVMGFDVRIDTVAVAHDSLHVYISPAKTIHLGGMPGETVKQPKAELGKGNLIALPGEGATIADVVEALNTVGATPKDLIAILQAIKDAGALHGELEVK